MSEAHHVTLASTSNAEDAAWLAVADVAAVATDLGIDYRLIGGNSVALLVHVHDAATQVPGRATADADMGISSEVCADPRLVPALIALGYDRQSGNRFIRTQGTRPLVIDVLAPSYLGRLMSNQPHGDLVVDEIPGLLDALRLPPVNVAARAILTDAAQVDVRVPLPDVRAALVMKAHAYVGRLGDTTPWTSGGCSNRPPTPGTPRPIGPPGVPPATPPCSCTGTSAPQAAADLVGLPRTAPTRRGSAH
jgi:hypothetical protein